MQSTTFSPAFAKATAGR